MSEMSPRTPTTPTLRTLSLSPNVNYWPFSIVDRYRVLGKLKHEVEKPKRTLSSQTSTKLEIESFEGGNDKKD